MKLNLSMKLQKMSVSFNLENNLIVFSKIYVLKILYM